MQKAVYYLLWKKIVVNLSRKCQKHLIDFTFTGGTFTP